MTGTSAELTIGQCATLACLLEATTPKPGNVHRGADFEDLSFVDFTVSAVAIAPSMERAANEGVGRAILDAIRATRHWVATNTNLGTVLLLAPMAAVPRNQSLEAGVPEVLASLKAQDAADVYEAIRLAEPGGLGEVDEMDVAAAPPPGLLCAMREASDRDMVARQYVSGFSTVFDEATPWLVTGIERGWSMTDSIIHTQMLLMRRYPDSLIKRKCGRATAQESSDRAARVLDAGIPGDSAYCERLADLDFWLRSDHHRRNPGTTADLIAAGLFAGLREGTLQPLF